MAERVVPDSKARIEEAWMVGPSAMGSEKGTPSSMMSAPPAAMACMRSPVRRRSGSPAVKKGTKAARRSLRQRANTVSMALTSSPL